MKVAAVCLSTTHAKSDGTELEMETQSDTRHNLKTTPTPTVSLHCEKLPPPCHLFITKKNKKKSLKADM